MPQNVRRSQSDLHYRYHLSSFARTFRNWRGFTSSIGEYEPEAAERLNENYYRVKEIVGYIPSGRDLDNKDISKYVVGTYAYHYGNYTNYLKSIGELPESATIYDSQLRHRRTPTALAIYKERSTENKTNIIRRYLDAKKRHPNDQVPRSWYEHGPHGGIDKHWGNWVKFITEMEKGLPTKILKCIDCGVEVVHDFSSTVGKTRCEQCRRIHKNALNIENRNKNRAKYLKYNKKYDRMINPHHEREIKCGNSECKKIFLTRRNWQKACCTKCYDRMCYLLEGKNKK